MKIQIDNKKKTIIIAIHILLTFLFERLIFVFSWDNILFRTTQPKNYILGDKTEMIMVYILSKICSIVIIVLLWKLIFLIKEKRIRKDVIKCFGSIFLVGLIIGVIVFPDNFGMEVDNYGVYALAIRFLPTYWHSIYTGIIYAGCLMVLPNPISIFIFQWLLLIVVIAYIYNGISELTNGNSIKYIPLVLLLVPETYELVFNAYRNNYYTIICMFYFSYIFFYFQNKKGNRINISIIFLSCFIMIWRTEGIIIGVFGLFFMICFCMKISKKELFKICILCIVIFSVLNGIQNIGAKKYYGKDYQIVSTINVLNNILNDEKAIITKSEIDKINACVPAQIIKETGIDGYRNYNYLMGRKDGNQTLMSESDSTNYISSYYSIVKNNFVDYIYKQISSYFYCIDFPFVDKTHIFQGKPTIVLPQYTDLRNIEGRDDILGVWLVGKWDKNEVRKSISVVIRNTCYSWQLFIKTTHIGTLYRMLVMLGIIRMFTYELTCFVKKTDYNIYGLIMSLGIILELLAVIAFMPEGRLYYLFPMMYSAFWVIAFNTIDIRALRLINKGDVDD
ncbi:hypothetical protein [Pseudobutyrivibrio sp. MD2005]|uniref:hypothetical protein n=1 Tax=Pseudobutyrivibrio sp. MD2005 TaxID=1410616 RepID=UPI0004804CC3|nr:hypothetical protein [Pseudobutyrivibrio sp. MD2005]